MEYFPGAKTIICICATSAHSKQNTCQVFSYLLNKLPPTPLWEKVMIKCVLYWNILAALKFLLPRFSPLRSSQYSIQFLIPLCQPYLCKYKQCWISRPPIPLLKDVVVSEEWIENRNGWELFWLVYSPFINDYDTLTAKDSSEFKEE